MGCRGVPILLLRLLSCLLKTSADFWSLNGSSIHAGCSTGTTGGLETFDSLDLMKDGIVESTSLFGYFSLEKIRAKYSLDFVLKYSLDFVFLFVRSLDDSLL